MNTLSNGAQVADNFDIGIQFGTTDNSTAGTVDSANFTLFSDNGPMTLADLNLDSFEAVVDSDGGNGQVLTAGDVAGADPVLVVKEALFENFDDTHAPEDSAAVESTDGWIAAYDKLVTNGSNDGTVTFTEVATDGPVSLNLNLLTHSTTNLENSGAYADSLRLEVQIDGGDWVLLDEYMVNDHGTAVVGSETGQSFGTSGSDVSYSGGILDTATESVQFRAISDISANNEYFKIDDFSVNVTEEVAGGGTTTNTVVLTEDFNDIHEPSDSDLIASDGNWSVEHDALFTNGHEDGILKLATVESDGPTTISFDASTDCLHNFEAGGYYGDELKLEVRLENGDWTTMDTFVINGDKSALVGSETGNEITQDSATLNYSGGILDDADGSVDYRFVSDISASNEIIRIDNLEVTTTEVVDADPAGKVTVDFNNANSGDVVDGQFEGVTVSAQRAHDNNNSENDAMIFDSNNPTGGDHDLEYAGQDNILIISEDNDSNDADDNVSGGTISFDFAETSEVQSLNLLDIEEQGGTIDLFDADGGLVNTIDIPAAGDNSNQVVDINTRGVSSMDVNLVGFGAVDDLMYIPESDVKGGQYDVTYLNGIPTLDPVEDDQFKDEDAADELDDLLV